MTTVPKRKRGTRGWTARTRVSSHYSEIEICCDPKDTSGGYSATRITRDDLKVDGDRFEMYLGGCISLTRWFGDDNCIRVEAKIRNGHSYFDRFYKRGVEYVKILRDSKSNELSKEDATRREELMLSIKKEFDKLFIKGIWQTLVHVALRTGRMQGWNSHVEALQIAHSKVHDEAQMSARLHC